MSVRTQRITVGRIGRVRAGESGRVTVELGVDPRGRSVTLEISARQAEALSRRLLQARLDSDDERTWLLAVLEVAGWNVSRAARSMGIARSTLRYRMKVCGVASGATFARLSQ